jgi:hypothetical protein
LLAPFRLRSQGFAGTCRARRPGGIGRWLKAVQGDGLSHGLPLLAVIDPLLRHHLESIQNMEIFTVGRFHFG